MQRLNFFQRIIEHVYTKVTSITAREGDGQLSCGASFFGCSTLTLTCDSYNDYRKIIQTLSIIQDFQN